MDFADYPEEDVKSEDAEGSELQETSSVRTATAVKERLFQPLQQHILTFIKDFSGALFLQANCVEGFFLHLFGVFPLG